jgi:glycosyltransferase involved in cell wall biosynthesis
MDISLIICTYNRAQLLKETIDSFFQMEIPKDTSYELIIVDNNSSDETKTVVNEFIKGNPHKIRYIYESKQGLNYARNRGIIESSGEIIAFTDDDIEFDKDWIKEILKTFKDFPDAWSMGGKIIPIFKDDKPEWISDNLMGIYGYMNRSSNIICMEFPDFPFEANMAFRKETFNKLELFPITLSRNNKSLLSNAGIYLFYLISRSEGKVIYNPHAFIKHKVQKKMITKKWILRRLYWQGISDVKFEQLTNKKPKKILLKEAYKDFASILRGIFGSSGISIKKLYWHIRSFEFNKWADYCRRIGVIRQKLISALI